MRRWKLWLLYGGAAWSAAGFLTYFIGYADDRRMFVPGETSHGHHQIELQCNVCHTAFMGVRTDACNQCHATELAAANDTHPRSKFTDPRNAALLEQIDAAQCVTCHREHRPELTHAMGVTQPEDYCFHCHRDIGTERPSHAGLPFNSCATAGCHNYHDNTALYEDFIAKHLDEPAVREAAVRRVRAEPAPTAGRRPLTGAERVVPAGVAVDQAIVYDWEHSAHARAGVNCHDCHQAGDLAQPWIAKPAEAACARCHEPEVKDFFASRHGMRLAAGLPALTPAEARWPMRTAAAHRTMTCNACHGAHSYDTTFAAVESCLQCHDDAHSRAYRGSKHELTWRAELGGEAPPGSGVSCAACHLPREVHRVDGQDVVRVQHNQNANLRPNEKMIRTVCLDCHGYAFAVDALADRALISANFRGRPSGHVDSIDMVLRRLTAQRPKTENQP